MAKPVLKNTREEILDRSIPLFATAGFHGVSMRDIAAAVGVRAAALYHHFPDKQTLYLAAMAHAFTDKSAALTAALTGQGSPLARLELFVATLAEAMSRDPDLLALLQRERLDGDEARLKRLAQEVFADPFRTLMGLAKELAPKQDPYLLAVSVAALVMFHLETAPLRRFFPGWHAEHDDPKRLAQHVCGLLSQMFDEGNQR